MFRGDPPKDPMIAALAKNGKTMTNIENIIKISDKITRDSPRFTLILSTAESFIESLRLLRVKPIDNSLQEVDTLKKFLDVLLQTLSLLPLDDPSIAVILLSIYYNIILVGSSPNISEPQKYVLTFIKLYAVNSVHTDTIDSIIRKIFTAGQNFAQICSIDFFDKLLKEICNNQENTQALSWITNVLHEYVNNYRKYAQETKQIMEIFFANLSNVPAQNVFEAFKLLAIFIQIYNSIENPLDEFISLNGFEAMDSYVNENEYPMVFQLFAISPGKIDERAICFIVDQLNKEQRKEKWIYCFVALVKNKDIPISAINDIYSIDKLFNLYIGTPQECASLVVLFYFLVERKYTKVDSMIFKLCELFPAQMKEKETLTLFFKAMLQYTSANNVKNDKFIDTFVKSPKLAQLIDGYPQFLTIVLNLYSNMSTPNDHYSVIKSLVDCQAVHAVGIARFIITKPSLILIQEIMQNMQQTKEGIEILLLAINDKEVCKLFTECDGLVWLDIFKLDVETMVSFVSVISRHCPKYTSKWVASLNLDHPFFSIDNDRLFKLAVSPKNEIIVPALLPLFPDFDVELSPSAQYSVSKQALAGYVKHNTMSAKMLCRLANRSVDIGTFQILLQKYPEPDKLVCLNSDHFGLFDFLEANDAQFTVHSQPLSVSFWFKELKQNTEATIFSTKCVSGKISNNSFSFEASSGESFTFPISPNVWHLVAVTISKGMLKTSLILQLNDSTQNINWTGDTLSLGDVTFGGPKSPSNEWLLSSIRFFTQPPPPPDVISKRGPSSMITVRADETIISAYTAVELGEGVKRAKYSGFAVFVAEPRYSYKVFDEAVQHPEKIESIVKLLVKSAVVTKDSPHLFSYTIQLMKRQILPSSLVREIIMSAASVEGSMAEIFSDLDLWEMYSKTMVDVFMQKYRLLPPGIELSLFAYVISASNDEALFRSTVAISFATASRKAYENLLDIVIASREDNKYQLISDLTDAMLGRPCVVCSSVFSLQAIVNLMLSSSQRTCDRLMDFAVIASVDNDYLKCNVLNFTFASLKVSYSKLWPSLLAMYTGSDSNDDPIQKYDQKPKRREFTSLITNTILIHLIVSIMAHSATPDVTYDDIFFDAISIVTKMWHHNTLLNDQTIYDTASILAPLIFDPNLANIENSAKKVSINFGKMESLWDLPNGYIPPISSETEPINLIDDFRGLYKRETGQDFPEIITIKSPLESTKRHSIIINFITDIMVSASDFSTIFKAFFGNIKTQEQGDLALNVIVALFAKSSFYSATPVTLSTILEYVIHCLHSGYFCDRFLFFSSFIPVIGAVFTSQMIENQNTMGSIRKILLEMFNIDKEMMPSAFELFNSMKQFMFMDSQLFNSFDFSCQFLSNLLLLDLSKPPHVAAIENFTEFMQLDVFKMKWNGPNITDVTDNINNMIKGKPYNNELIEETHRYLAAFTREISLHAMCFQYDTAALQRVISKVALNRLRVRHVRNAMTIAADAHRGLIMRKMEDKFVSLYQLAHPSFFSPKSFRLNPCTWPFDTPRVLAPTDIALPSISEESQAEDFMLPEVPLSNYFLNPKQLYARRYTPFAPFNGLNPLQYSETPSDRAEYIWNSFVQMHGTPKASFSCKFERLNEPLDCAVFMYDGHFFIVLNALVSEGKLELTQPSAPVVFRSTAEEIALGLMGPFSLFCGHFVLKIEESEITSAAPHLFCHMPHGVEVATLRGCPLVLYAEEGLPAVFLRDCERQWYPGFLASLPLLKARDMWLSRELATYDYLLVANAAGGRSFSDLSQYPVFPWVIADYDSEGGPHATRDLAKPMGQLDAQRAAVFESSATQGYMYGAHYSMAASVHFFMLRTPPFTYLSWDLHNGWDNSARMFFNLGYSYLSASKLNTNDVKEQIPEMYAVPEMFENPCQLPLEPVVLPKWAKSATHYIVIAREQLDSANIEPWLDLIFGSSQTGPAAIAAKNVFLPGSYHKTPVFKDGETISTLALQLEHWGQCPIQIFKKPHPKRNSPNRELIMSMSPGAIAAPADGLDFILSQEQMTLTALSASKTYVYHNRKLRGAINLSTTENGCIIVIDFKFGFTTAYFSNIQKGAITAIKPMATFAHLSQHPRSFVSGRDRLVLTTVGPEAILWDAVRGFEHRRIVLGSDVCDAGFDERLGHVWIATRNDVRLFTVNGAEVSGWHSENRVTAFAVIQTPGGARGVVGTISGHVSVLRLDPIACRIESALSSKMSSSPMTSVVVKPMLVYLEDSAGQFFSIRFTY